MAALLEAYITNLGRYAEDGVEAGATLKFPATTEELQSLLKRIGVDGVRYEEIFITSFDGDVLGLHEHLGEYEDLDELNHLAHLLSDLEQDELEKFEAVIDSGEYTGSVKDLINLTQNLDCFDFEPGIISDEELGRLYVLDFGAVQVPESLIDYIDYEAFGRDARINADMCITTAVILLSTTRAGMTFPPSTGFSPIPSFPSGSRWRPTRRL